MFLVRWNQMDSGNSSRNVSSSILYTYVCTSLGDWPFKHDSLVFVANDSNKHKYRHSYTCTSDCLQSSMMSLSSLFSSDLFLNNLWFFILNIFEIASIFHATQNIETSLLGRMVVYRCVYVSMWICVYDSFINPLEHFSSNVFLTYSVQLKSCFCRIYATYCVKIISGWHVYVLHTCYISVAF